MCGISIAVSKISSGVDHGIIKEMNDKIMHRGPDDEGFLHFKNLAFGHRRLSILDLSKAGHQPMNRDHLWITFNGEIYNYIELKNDLAALGYNFYTATDTEVILAAYDAWGIESFSKFNGMWAFSILDTTNNEVIFCRDHFGIKPLYFTENRNYFLAGSEIKQFFTLNEFKPKLNKKIAVNFLTRGLLNYSNETFFDAINELRPGHFLKYSLSSNDWNVTQWYDLETAATKVKDPYETAKTNLRNLFVKSNKIRMRSDVRVGSCLSGGIDSSSIVSVVNSQHLANTDFATITSCYAEAKYDEQEFSDLVTKDTGIKSLKVFPDLSDLIEKNILGKIIYHQDQPIATTSHFSEYKVFEKARENNMIVMLDGQGSDEYLCGYGEYFIAYISTLIRKGKIQKVLQELRQSASNKSTSLSAEIKQYLKTKYYFKVIKYIKKFSKKEQYPWLHENWRTIADNNEVYFEENNIRDLSITEIQRSSIPYQLHSEDRNSMLFSIESRLPFLDNDLVEYAIGLPDEFKIRNGFTKFILREAITELPEKIKYRKDKMGFVAPEEIWVKDNAENIRLQLLKIINDKNIFSMNLIERFDKFIKGELKYEPIYFRALSFHIFCDIFNVEIS